MFSRLLVFGGVLLTGFFGRPLASLSLRHGTRVHLLPTKRHGTATALSVRPMDVPQQGLTVGVDNQVNYRGAE